MIKVLTLCSLLLLLVMPVSALEIEAPEVPDSGKSIMPESVDNFTEALTELTENALPRLRTETEKAASGCIRVLSTAIIMSILRSCSDKTRRIMDLAGVTVSATILFSNSGAFIALASDTIQELSDYGKLLFPVMTAAMASQGGITASTALYTGTAAFDSILSTVISSCFLPAVYLFLALAAAYGATGEELLKKIRDLIKNSISWCLKTLLTVFTTYMSITGVVSGTADAAALKAAKVTISSVVPVVGGILSDASETVLVSAGLMKNAAGIYGIVAILAVFLTPFLRIGIQYLLLKALSALCSIFGSVGICTMTEDFAAAMGLLLAMTSSVCLMLLVSTVCFMKGVA